MVTTITSDEKLRHINNMLSEISNIYQKLLLSKNVPESVFIVMSSILELGEGCLQKDIISKMNSVIVTILCLGTWNY